MTATILVVDDEPDLEALVLQKYDRYGGDFSRMTLSVVGTNRTSRGGLTMSVDWGRPEVVGPQAE